MWDLVGNSEDRFSHNEAQLSVMRMLSTLKMSDTFMYMQTMKFGEFDEDKRLLNEQ